MRLAVLFTLMLALDAGPVQAAQSCNTAIPETTRTSAFTFNLGGTVTDNRTGLEWQRCLLGQTFSDNSTSGNFLDDSCSGVPTAYTWQGALAAAAAGSGWRLPNFKELGTIAEYRCYSPAANLQLFPNMDNYVLWSASPYAGDPVYAWFLSFDYGGDGADTGFRGGSSQVRLVRGGQ